MDKVKKYLRLSMLIGFIVDLFMVIIFIVPALRIIVFGESPQFHTPQYEWAMRLVGSCGLYITISLFWASLKPIERKDILLFIVFPLMLCA
jgi:hypothetical protein